MTQNKKETMNKVRMNAIAALEERFGINMDAIVGDGIDEAIAFVVGSVGTDVPLEIVPSSFMTERDAKSLMLAASTLMRTIFIFECLEETFEEEDGDEAKVEKIEKVKERIGITLATCVDLCVGYAIRMGYVDGKGITE